MRGQRVAEALWSSLKRELTNRYRFATRTQARQAIFKWINWYNQHRLHSTLGYFPPVEWEMQYSQQHHAISGQQAAWSSVRLKGGPSVAGFRNLWIQTITARW